MDEVWKAVPGFDGYEVSNLGRVGSWLATGNYGKKPKERRILRPQYCECAHGNAIRDDNRLENLRWATPSENQRDKVAHGTSNRGERCGSARLSQKQVLAIRNDQRSNAQIAREYGVNRITIFDIKHRRTWAWLD